MDIISYSIGDSAPPYIIIAISLTLIIGMIGIRKQYREHNINIYEVYFAHIKLNIWINFFTAVALALLTFSLLNILLSFDMPLKNILQFLIKISLFVSSYSLIFGLFEYYSRSKEELSLEN
jgi:hypothetical protein